MAHTLFSLLLLKRLSLSSQNPKLYLPLSIFLYHSTMYKPFSTSQTSSTPSPSSSDPKPSSLSARMSFIFDQIDAIEKERSQKDQTLQKIRAWRESKKTPIPLIETPKPESEFGSVSDVNAIGSELKLNESQRLNVVKRKDLELVHPWPEWMELMERLVKQNYFDHRRKDEDKMVQELGFDASEIALEDDVGLDFTKDFKAVQTACLNFGKDRFDILRSLSRQDIQILVGFGCPSADKKVVFSAKLLRKLVHLDEGDVCSSCSLRNSCERAFLLTNKEDEARTIDVMRVLLTFGFDPMNGSVVNDSLLKRKSVKTVVRKLLHEVVKLCSVPVDPNLPPPVIKKPPPKVKQPPPPPKRRVGRDDIEMKKGDWLCPKCDFMNFAKNSVCLQCDAKRPKRQLLPGEWECPECNFLNYRRNMVCFHCECKRPPDAFMDNKMQERQHGPRTRLEKIASRDEVSNAWNFDFDDNESDGADVAAFEYADSSVMSGASPLDAHVHGGENVRGLEGNFKKVIRGPRDREYSDAPNNRPSTGFDDFEDEEDDIDSYELDTPNNSTTKAASIDFSDVEGYSDKEDIEKADRQRTGSRSYDKQSKFLRQKAALSGSDDDGLGFDSDEELSGRRVWKSSHVADSRQRSRGRGPSGPRRGLSYGSDEEFGLHSDEDDDDIDENFGSRQNKRSRLASSGRRYVRARGSSDFEDGRFSGLDTDDDRNSRGRSRFSGNNRNSDRRENSSKPRSRGNYKFTRDDESSKSSLRGGRMNSFRNDADRDNNRRFHDTHWKFTGNDGDRRRMNDRGSDMRNFKGSSERGFGKKQQGMRNEYDKGGDSDYSEFKNSRRVIER